MAGYTRQASSNIVTGGVIDAADFNAEYNAIENAFNASTGHDHSGTTGNGPPIQNLGPAQDFVVTSSVVRPKTTNTYDFGTSLIQWKDGFFDGTLRTDVLTVDETSTFTGNVTTVADVAIGGNLTVTGNATINGNLTFGDSAADSVSFGADILTNLIPDGTTQDLGSSTKQWRDLYIDGTANIDSLVADTADINGGNIDGTVIGANSSAAITGTTITASTNFAGDLTGDVTGDVSGNAGTATTLETARTIAVSGAVTGSASFNGGSNITIATTATSDPTLTLSGDVTGSATFTNLGNATLTTSLAADSVGSSEIASGAVDTAELAADAVTTAKIAAGAVDTTELADDAITSAKIATNAVNAAAIAAGAVGGSEIASGAVGAGELNVTGNGTSGQLLASDGDGTFSWVTATTTNNATITISAGTGLTTGGAFTTNQGTNETITLNLTGDQRLAAATDVYVGNSHEHIHFNDGSQHIEFMTGGAEEMRLENDGDLHVDGNITAYSTTVSDQRLKHDIQKIDSALDKVSQLSGYTFSYNKDGKRSAGVIAQEVEKVLPSAVENKSLVFHGQEGIEYKTVQYDQLHGLLIEAIKELKTQVEELKNGSTE